MKRFLKVLAFISILALIVNFIGCQATGDKKQPDGAKDISTTDEKTTVSSTDSNADDNLNPLGTFPIAKTKTKLSLLMAQDPLVEDYETNSFTKWVEDRCNIDLEFEILPAADSGDKLAIMISSNQTLPDVVNMGLNIVTTYKYGSGGAFVPLNDYYETQSYYIKQQLQKYPETDIIRYTQTPDGKLYSIPSYYKENHSEVRWKYWINTHWLNKLGLEMPTTTDDLYTVLKAFKERDPNGNNKADEYGIVGSTGGGSGGDTQDPTVFLMNAFIYNDNGNNLIVEDDKVTVSYITDAWREGLRYMNRLCKEKLLDPISFTQDNSQLRAMVDNPDDCIVGCFSFMSITLLPVATSPYQDYYDALMPLKGPDGVQLTTFNPTVPTNRWFITRNCSNPVLAFRVGDSFFNEEAFLRGRFGVEGEHWSRPAEDDISVYDGVKPMYVQDVNIWTLSQNDHWRNNTPAFTYDAMQAGVWPKNEDGTRDPRYYSRRIALAVMEYEKYKPKEGTFVPLLYFNEQELNEISEIQSTLNTYVKECKIRFIMGDLDIDNDWDSYLEEINRIGLDKFLEACQTVYERMYK